MKVLDLRPWTVRFMARRWGQRDERGAGGLPRDGRLATLARRLGDKVMANRVKARRIPSGSPWLISVGNLALGGTGKTPVVMALAQAMAATGLRGAILTRGFGSSLKGPLEVAVKNTLAGDEARLMAGAMASCQWTVVQSRDRLAGLTFLMHANPHLDLVLIEDGHQTADLGRHLDILILDQWQVGADGEGPQIEARTGPVFPFGPWRESAAGADRARVWLMETDAPLPAQAQSGTAVCGFVRQVRLMDSRGGGITNPGTESWAVLSGIARPEAFEAHAAALMGTEPTLAIRCGDHAAYGAKRVADIVRKAESAGCKRVVTTAKDWIKVKDHWPQRMAVFIVDLEIIWSGHNKTLPELVGEGFAAFKSSS